MSSQDRQEARDDLQHLPEGQRRLLQALMDYAPSTKGRNNIIKDIIDNAKSGKLEDLYHHYFNLLLAGRIACDSRSNLPGLKDVSHLVRAAGGKTPSTTEHPSREVDPDVQAAKRTQTTLKELVCL